MKKYLVLNLISLIPIFLFGQTNASNSVLIPAPIIPCNLEVIKFNRDTFITYISPNCNLFYFDSLKNGIWKIYSSDSVLLEIASIKNGSRNRYCVSFFNDGSIKEKADYKNGFFCGEYISYYPNGKINQNGIYKLKWNEWEVFTGTFSEWWDNGNIAHVRTIKNNNEKRDKF